MLLRQIKNVAGDFGKNTRWILANLTGDDANRDRRELLSQLRIVGIGRKYVRGMRANGEIVNVEPFVIQRVW